jgi:CubicO group peptidase (beta-lactamase class C family)
MFNLNWLLYRPRGTVGGEKLVTIRSLLSQLSGLQRESPLGNTNNYTTSDALKALQSSPLILEPYVRPSYSNLAFALAGRGIEPLMGATFEQLTQKNIFDALGMNRSGLAYAPQIVREMATGYDATGVGIKPGDQLQWTSPAGQAYSTIRDLLRLGNSLLAGSDALLSSSGKKELLKPLWFNQDGISGFGTPFEMQIIAAAPGVSIVVPTKGGNIGGYSSLFAVLPDFNVTLSILWNSAVDEGTIGRLVLNKLVPQLYSYTIAHLEGVVPVPESLIQSALGVYQTPLAPGINFTLSVDSLNRAILSIPTREPTMFSYIGQLSKSHILLQFPWSMSLPPMGCQGQMETAVQGQLVHVNCVPNVSWQITIPGYMPGVLLSGPKCR